MTEKIVYNVYAEMTPNPESMKFVANHLILPESKVEFLNKAEAKDCPLAFQLFDFTGVRSVFITSNFVTINKAKDIDWYDITNILREFIQGFLNSGEKIFLKAIEPEIFHHEIKKEEEQNKTETRTSEISNPEIEIRIKQMLEEYVRPAVEGDGGAIDFKSYNSGIVTVILKGACSGCPSSTLTLKSGIENLLKRMVPEVTEVVAESV
jgi:Fe-S cluster biogenesis protein NfuA